MTAVNTVVPSWHKRSTLVTRHVAHLRAEMLFLVIHFQIHLCCLFRSSCTRVNFVICDWDIQVKGVDPAMENRFSHSTSLVVTTPKAPDMQNHLPPLMHKYLESWPPTESCPFISLQNKPLQSYYQISTRQIVVADSRISTYTQQGTYTASTFYTTTKINTTATFATWIHILGHPGQQRLLAMALALALVGEFLNSKSQEIQRFVITMIIANELLIFTFIPVEQDGERDGFELCDGSTHS